MPIRKFWTTKTLLRLYGLAWSDPANMFSIFLKMGYSRPLVSLFSSFQYSWQHIIYIYIIRFADDWIRTVDLWCRKGPLYQLSHDHCPSFTTLVPVSRSCFSFTVKAEMPFSCDGQQHSSRFTIETNQQRIHEGGRTELQNAKFSCFLWSNSFTIKSRKAVSRNCGGRRQLLLVSGSIFWSNIDTCWFEQM